MYHVLNMTNDGKKIKTKRIEKEKWKINHLKAKNSTYKGCNVIWGKWTLNNTRSIFVKRDLI